MTKNLPCRPPRLPCVRPGWNYQSEIRTARERSAHHFDVASSDIGVHHRTRFRALCLQWARWRRLDVGMACIVRRSSVRARRFLFGVRAMMT